MKKFVMVLVALTSVSAYAFPTKAQLADQLRAGRDAVVAAAKKANAAAKQTPSWDELRADLSVLIGNPFNQAFGPEGAFNVCYTDTELHSKKPVAYCADLQQIEVSDGEGLSHTEYRCNPNGGTKYSDVRLPRTYDAAKCVKDRIVTTGGDDVPYWECIEWGTERVTTPTSFNLDVSRISGNGDIRFQFSKPYDLEKCP